MTYSLDSIMMAADSCVAALAGDRGLDIVSFLTEWGRNNGVGVQDIPSFVLEVEEQVETEIMARNWAAGVKRVLSTRQLRQLTRATRAQVRDLDKVLEWSAGLDQAYSRLVFRRSAMFESLGPSNGGSYEVRSLKPRAKKSPSKRKKHRVVLQSRGRKRS